MWIPKQPPINPKKEETICLPNFGLVFNVKKKVFVFLKIQIFIISSKKTFFNAFFVGDDQIWSIL